MSFCRLRARRSRYPGTAVRRLTKTRYQGKAMRIEVIVDVKTTLGEGPLWDAEQERLYWIDSFDGRVFRATALGHEIRCWDVPQKIGSMALRKEATGRSFRSRAVSTLLIS